MTKEKKTTRRTKIKDLSGPKKMLSGEEMKKVAGGRQSTQTITAASDNNSSPANTVGNATAVHDLTSGAFDAAN